MIAALDGLVGRGGLEVSTRLPGLAAVQRPVEVVQRPRALDDCDYTSGVALQRAKYLGVPPLVLAGLLAAELRRVEGVAAVTPAGPGFLNITLSAAARGAVALEVVGAGAAYGHVDGLDLNIDLGTPGGGELVALVDADVLRYAVARGPGGMPLVVDVDRLSRASTDNPLYGVQYAHARLASLLRNGAALGVRPSGAEDFDPALLDHPREHDLLRLLADYPRAVARAAHHQEPHRVTRILEDTAASFHRVHDTCRVLPQGDEEPTELHRARLLLVDATRIVMANGLHLLGVAAPERM